MRPRTLALLLFGVAAPAMAADLRDYCPDRPGLNTPACITDRGHLSVETSLADWTRDKMPDQVQDTVLVGDLLLRYGISDRIEAQLGWTPLGLVRTRDRMDGSVRHQDRMGDVLVGFKANLLHPDGEGVALAVLPSATLPVGRTPVGAGDWSAGVRVPFSVKVSELMTVSATPEVDAEVNESGDGRHLRFGSAAGVQFELKKNLHYGIGAEVMRDRDPESHATLARASTSIAWQPQQALQLDAGVVAGLNHDSPRVELYVGVSRRF